MTNYDKASVGEGGAKMKEALKKVSLLAERFQQNIEADRNPAGNETRFQKKFDNAVEQRLNPAGWSGSYRQISTGN